MKKIIALTLISLFFQSASGQQDLYKKLKKYMPYVPFEKKADSLFNFFSSNSDFTADSISPGHIKGEFKNFNPPGLNPSKIVIEATLDRENSLYYVVRICLDTSAASKKLLQTTVEKLRRQVVSFFSKDIGDESGKKDKSPYKIYNFYSAGRTFPSMLLGWGYNQSVKFTGYYFSISLFLDVQQ